MRNILIFRQRYFENVLTYLLCYDYLLLFTTLMFFLFEIGLEVAAAKVSTLISLITVEVGINV